MDFNLKLARDWAPGGEVVVKAGTQIATLRFTPGLHANMQNARFIADGLAGVLINAEGIEPETRDLGDTPIGKFLDKSEADQDPVLVEDE